MKCRDIGLACAIPAIVLTVLVSTAVAGNNPNAKVAVHVMAHDDSRRCSAGFPEIDFCYDIVATYPDCGDIDVFPVFFDLVEYLTLNYALTWPGTGTCVFASCSDFSIGSITMPGDKISQAWAGCRPGPAVIPGFGWIAVSGPGAVSVLPHPDFGAIYINDCAGGSDQVYAVLGAGVCGANTGDPCLTSQFQLYLEKQDDAGPGCIANGDTAVYTISYENPHAYDMPGVVIVDYLPDETEYVSSSPPGGYDAGMHTVTWQVGNVPGHGSGSVELLARVLSDAPSVGAVLNTCAIKADYAQVFAAWDSTLVCCVATRPTTWGKIKSMFR